MSDPVLTDFPGCMHALAGALHRQFISPGNVEIVLPHDDWFRLYQVVESRFPNMAEPRFDGRSDGQVFRWMGFNFRAKA